MSTSRPPSKPLDLDITIVSAKHLKNVNWRHGDLTPYAIFWVDSDRRLATKSDDSGSTRPVWNERFLLPLSLPLHESFLNIEIFHSKPSETSKPLIGALQLALKDLVDPDDSTRLRTFELRRPSGRPQGKIHIKVAVSERPSPPAADYHSAPPSSYYYSTAPPHSVRDYKGYSPSPFTTSPLPPPAPSASPSPSPLLPLPPPPPHRYPYGSYSDPYSGYYSGFYSPQPSPPGPPPPPRPFFDRQSSYGGPSAPVDYTPYDQKQRSGKMGGFGTGLAVGAAAGALGGLALEEGLKREEDKIAERVDSDFSFRDDYSDYRSDYGYN